MVGSGGPACGQACAHGPIRPLRGSGQALQHPRDGVGVAVGPAAHRVHRRLDPREVLAHRPLLPVVVAALVGHPRVDERRRALHPLDPHVAPALADDRRVGRPRVPHEHRGGPLHHVGRDAAAVVVHVVGVAVVGRAERDDRLQRRRPVRRDLQAVEPAPRDADHAHRAGAPRLGCDPLDHLAAVGLLLRQVLVQHQPVGLAGASLVNADAGVPVAGQVREVAGVAGGRAVVQAVRQELEDRRDGILLRVLGQPDAGRQPGAVAERDPRLLDRAHAAREVGDDGRWHGGGCYSPSSVGS